MKSEREFVKTLRKFQSGKCRTKEERIEFYRKMLDCNAEIYGREEAVRMQIERTMEELSELQIVLVHLNSRPNRESLYHLLEEVADVSNVCESLCAIYPMLETFLNAAKDSKMDKLEEFIEDGTKQRLKILRERELADKLFKENFTFWNSPKDKKEMLKMVIKKMKRGEERAEIERLITLMEMEEDDE